jgi:carbon monoxide dehydrogenase subunit G
VIPAAAEAVWAALSRFEDISRWGPGVSQSSLLTEASGGVGAIRRVQVGRNALRETITRWEPMRSLGYTIMGLPPVVRQASNTWTLASEGAGTRVTLTAEVTTKGGPVIGHLVAGKVGKANKQLLAGLRDHVTAP